MNNQTRSEIEQAFARPDSSLKRPKDPRVEARGSKILGGNISGVEKPKRLRFGIGWWFSIGIAALVAIVLLIPTPERRVEAPSDTLAQLPEQPKSDPIYQESRVQEEGERVTQNDEFTSGSDVDRANEFRQSEKLATERKAQEEKANAQIKELTKKAKATIRKGAYTEPEKDNALKYYNEILKISPDNTFALNGIDYITERFAVIGAKHIEKGHLDNARGALATLFSIDGTSEQYIELSDKITEYELSLQISPEQKEINQLEEQAITAIKRDRFTTPAGDNALFYYQKILTIDPKNEVAITGIKSLAGRYALLANEALNESELEKAESYVATIAAISPEHPSLALLANRIVKANESQKEELSAAETEALGLNNPADLIPVVKTPTVQTPIAQTTPQVSNDNLNNTFDDELSKNSSKELDEVRLKNGLGAYYSGNYERAIEYLQPLADKGIARAQVRVGYMYYLGRGVNQNRGTGEKYLKSAMPAVTQFAQEDRAWAQADMGSLFEDGVILKQSYPSAVEWYRKAANQGYAGAQTNLGNMYYGGRGVEKNIDTAVGWFKQAAKNGDAVAKRNLVALGVTLN